MFQELSTRITALTRQHQLSNAPRLQRAAALQTQLTHRVLKVVQHLHLLIPAVRSSAIRPEEEAIRAALEDVDQEIRRPGGIGRMRGKLNELWALVGAVSAARERDHRAGSVEWAVVDEQGLSQLAQVTFLMPTPHTVCLIYSFADTSGGAGGSGASNKNPAAGSEGSGCNRRKDCERRGAGFTAQLDLVIAWT